jgi:2-succinyl-5-enolpyruvyl-6-hydroxy-3-cyclohexene-1-carboxylate synthase
MIDFRNVNTLWASVLVETLHHCGVNTAVICPGSRSTPLTIAFANHPQIEAIPILDERSASFFALGRSKKTRIPTVLVCTSGTAGANFYPAVIEAQQSGVPLLILTADRPPELRYCHAGQTIDQLKLYGNFPNWQGELAIPEASLAMLGYLRQTIVQAWRHALFPTPGVVHLNLPFREPLAPIKQSLWEIETAFPQDFFTGIISDLPSLTTNNSLPLPWNHWYGKSGIIIAGLAQPQDPEIYCQAIALLAQALSFPVLAEALSPVRNYAHLNPYLISTYDSILRQATAQQLIPEVIIQVGELPTSKQLRTWLQSLDVTRWVIDARIDNFDPLHGKTIHLQSSVEQMIGNLEVENTQPSVYCQLWRTLETVTRTSIDQTLESLEQMYEGKAAWLLSQTLPWGTPIFLANSMSVRNAEYFWHPNQHQLIPYFNRGANGIDGTLSTALGMAYQDVGVLLTGDLAFLHDTNGLLIKQKFQGHLTIVLINNNGGGIFEILPIVDFPDFEEYFATPQAVNLPQLCSAYGLEYVRITDWQQLRDLTVNFPPIGIRVLEIICDRHQDAIWLKNNLPQFGKKK